MSIAIFLILNFVEIAIFAKFSMDFLHLRSKLLKLCNLSADLCESDSHKMQVFHRKYAKKSARISDRSRKWIMEREKKSRGVMILVQSSEKGYRTLFQAFSH